MEPFSNPPFLERPEVPATGNSVDDFLPDLGDDLDEGADNYGRERPADAADHGFGFRGSGVRAFLLPPSMLKVLRRGTPGMGLALSKAMVFGEDPDIVVQLGDEVTEPPRLAVTVTSDSVFDELRVDPASTSAEVVGIAIMIADMIAALRRDHADAVRGLDLLDLVRGLLVEGERRSS